MDTVYLLLGLGGILLLSLAGWLWWLTLHAVRWGQVERVKLTLAEQEEALSSLFDKLNTVLARWRKREQREEKRQEEAQPEGPSDHKRQLYRRWAEQRASNGSINRLSQHELQFQEEEGET